MNIYSFSVLCFSFGVTLIAVLALAKRRDAIAVRFLFFSISNCGWGYLFSFWINQIYSLEMTLLLSRLSHAFAVFIPITWIHFVFEFIDKKEPCRYFYLINYISAWCLAGLCLRSDLFISGMHSILEFKYYTSAGPFYHLFTLTFWAIVPYGLLSIKTAYESSNDLSRGQIRNLLLGTFFGFVSGAMTFIPIYHIPLPLHLLILMPLYPFFTGIALIKYGLFDPKQIADAFQREKITTLGILAASLNHEMRNPLYIAKGRIEGYRAIVENKGAASGEKTEEVIRSVSTQLDRTLDIMQRFSDFAKPINTHKDKELFVLGDLIQNVLELVSYALVSQKIEVKVDIEPGLQLRCSRRQLEEVLVNLMTNACQAIKFDPRSRMQDSGAESRGSGKLTQGKIEVRAYQSNGKLTVEISDNGPGMNGEQLARVFEPFYTTKDRGTGLGLYITKQLVEKNGGKISVKSKTSHGTSFLINIPSVEPLGAKL